MTTTFVFSFDSTKNGAGRYCKTFQSSDGEQYLVNVYSVVKRSSDNYYNRYGTLTVQWNKMCNKIIRIKSYHELNKYLISESLFFPTDQVKVTAELLIVNVTSGNMIVVIDIIPYTHIPKFVDRPQSADKQILTPQKTEAVIEKRLEQLSTDMKNLLQTGTLADVILISGSDEIHAHKLILSVRSTVFAKMFQHPMKENLENRITIKDISTDALNGLLNFMYTGTAVLKDMKVARELYIAADKYDVKNLKIICSEMLKSVGLDNVLDTLLLADLYSDKVLKEASLTYIANNYSQLKTLPNWSSFMKGNQTLAIEILSFVLDKKV